LSIARSGPVEAPDELPVHEDRVALGDRVHRRTTDRGVSRRDREGEETSARLRNGDTQFGDLMYLVGDMTEVPDSDPGRASFWCRGSLGVGSVGRAGHVEARWAGRKRAAPSPTIPMIASTIIEAA
jgi:hypothetical protein